MANRLGPWWWIVLAAWCGTAGLTLAGPVASEPTTTQVTTLPAAPAVTPGFVELRTSDFWPALDWENVCWFAAIVTLALTIRMKPLLALRNLDGLVLAGMCLLLSLREAAGGPVGGTHVWRWWSYLGLTAAAVYWLLRGMALLASRQPVRHPGMVSGGVRLILVLAGLILCIQQIITAPLSNGSCDAIVGGLCTEETGKLPYGDALGFQNRSPLLYLIHVPAIRAVEPMLLKPGEEVERSMTWGNRSEWLEQRWQGWTDLPAARLVNAVLFVALLVGLLLIGARLQVEGSAWLMVALVCVFPGTLECLARPEIMLPGVLLVWTVAFALVPGVGGLLATVCLVLAGVAWPWAWLGLPLVLAYCSRRGWQVLGSLVGLGSGAALCVYGLMTLVQPAIPEPTGALAMAALQPGYTARLADADTVVVDQHERAQDAPKTPAASSWLWKWLVTREAATLLTPGNGASGPRYDWPVGVSGEGVLYREVAPDKDALPVLQRAYRVRIAHQPPLTRVLVAARTVLEPTWLRTGESESPSAGAWALWGGAPVLEQRWILIRRVVKVLVLALVFWATLVIFLGRRNRPRHLLGALALTASGTLLASEAGAVTNLVWLVPLVTAFWAVHEPSPAPRPVTVPSTISFEPGPAPRITLAADGQEVPR